MRRTVLAFLTLAALAAPAAAQSHDAVGAIVRAKVDAARVVRYQGRDREEQTERTTRTLRVGSDGEISLGNIAGDITVTRGNGDATLEIVKTARGRTVEDAREMLKLVTVEVSERGTRAEVKAQYPEEREMRRDNRRNINVSVAFNLTAPAGTRITINSISGSIKVTDIKGDLSLNTISGAVRVANAGRIATAKSISGTVEIADTDIDGAMEAGSVSGDIVLRRVRARRLELGVVSGNVLLQDLQCDRVTANSISGDVEFRGALARNGRYSFTSHSGEVRIILAGDTGFELNATTFSGTLHPELPLTYRGRDRDAGRPRSLHGTYGDGSAVLDVTTFSGRVVISKR
jgi:Toastrack DUF4097